MNGQFAIIKKTYLWLILGVVLVLGSWLIFGLNVKFSSDFTGGVRMTLNNNLQESKVKEDLSRFLDKNGFKNSVLEVQNNDELSIITIKTSLTDDAKVNELSEQLKIFLLEDGHIKTSDDILDLSITGPSVGKYMQGAAIKALILGIIFMAIYMLFSFSTIRKYISPATLAGVTIITMLFDISIPVGAFGFWMMINPTIQVDTIFIIAILTTMGYSINDTIIVFDRIRENIQEHGNREQGKLIYGQVFEKSLWQTMRRSIGTSVSTLLVIVAMYILGTGVIKQFAFTIGIGVLAGTYSSIFIAAPLAYLFLGKFKSEKNKLK